MLEFYASVLLVEIYAKILLQLNSNSLPGEWFHDFVWTIISRNLFQPFTGNRISTIQR